MPDKSSTSAARRGCGHPARGERRTHLEEHGYQRDAGLHGGGGPGARSPVSRSISWSPTCGCPGIDGTDAHRKAAVQQLSGASIGIVVTGYGTIRDAVEAIKPRRPRLHHQAVPVRPPAARAGVCRRAAAAAIGERLPPVATGGSLPLRGDRRQAAAPMRRLFALLETVAGFEQHGACHRRNRHGQGAGRPKAIHHNSPRRRATVRGAQLRRHPGDRSWRPSCSATCAARSPGRSATGRAGWSRPTRARSSSTRWAR